jgi:hypothetical protein
MSQMTVVDLLTAARRLLDESTPGTVSAWSRAAALLGRQALESALHVLWRTEAPGVERLNMRAQLNCLPVYLPADGVASEVTYTWAALSRATHHHPYELDPTREELSSLLASTERLTHAIAAAVSARRASQPTD